MLPTKYQTTVSHSSFKNTEFLLSNTTAVATEVTKRQKHSKKLGPASAFLPNTLLRSLEGVYFYTNKCHHIFQATIECGVFEDGTNGPDLDLCLYSEHLVGTIMETEDVPGSLKPLKNGGFFQWNERLPVVGQPMDPDNLCVFSGTFRKSSAMEGPALNAIPLASSKGCVEDLCCENPSNFQLVVKGTLRKEDGHLALEFSKDYGTSFYTDEITCPLAYIGKKVTDNSVVLPVGNKDASSNNAMGRSLSSHQDKIEDLIYRVAICAAMGPLLALVTPMICKSQQ